MTTGNYRRRAKWWLDNNNHRNYWCHNIELGVKVINDDSTPLGQLLLLGYMKPGRIINEGRDQYFHVTEAGIIRAREEFFRARQTTKT